MRTRRQEDRDNDITAVDCAACGDEGYTRQSGGNIDTFGCVGHNQTVDVCETCTEDFHRYGLLLPQDDSELTLDQWVRLHWHINVERKEREDETLVPELAEQFCVILNGWLTPEQMNHVVDSNRIARITGDFGVCHSHDFCDANQAMLDAWEWMFGKDEVPAIIEAGTGNAEQERDNKLWNAAWSLAKGKEFKCVAS